MKVGKSFGLGFSVALLSMAALGANPSSTQVMEEIVVTAAQPPELRMDEIVLAEPKPVNLFAQVKKDLAQLAEEFVLRDITSFVLPAIFQIRL